MKPLSADVHSQLAEWVKRGGVLVVCDDDSDPFNSVRDWWNTGGLNYRTPREHLFDQLGFSKTQVAQASTPAGSGSVPLPGENRETDWPFGKGRVIWLHENPIQFTRDSGGADQLVSSIHRAADHA